MNHSKENIKHLRSWNSFGYSFFYVQFFFFGWGLKKNMKHQHTEDQGKAGVFIALQIDFQIFHFLALLLFPTSQLLFTTNTAVKTFFISVSQLRTRSESPIRSAWVVWLESGEALMRIRIVDEIWEFLISPQYFYFHFTSPNGVLKHDRRCREN